MSRRTTPASGGARDARRDPPDDEARGPAASGSRGALFLLAAAIAALVAIVWWRFGRGPAATADPLAATTPEQAEEIGLLHAGTDEFLESLPWLRRGTQAEAGTSWSSHYNLALVLARVSTLSKPRSGIDLPLARSSIERVEIALECERAFARARELAPTDVDRAAVESAFAEFQYTWGRMMETYVLLRAAQAHAPGFEGLASRAEQIRSMIENRPSSRTAEPAR